MYMQYIHIYQYTYTYVYIYLDPRMTPKFWAGPKKKACSFFRVTRPFFDFGGWTALFHKSRCIRGIRGSSLMSLDCYLGSKVSFWHIWPQRPLWSEGAPFPPACNSQLMTYGRRIYLNHWSVLAPQVFFFASHHGGISSQQCRCQTWLLSTRPCRFGIGPLCAWFDMFGFLVGSSDLAYYYPNRSGGPWR